MRFSEEHIRMIRETIPEGCSEGDFQRFLFNAERLELDPLLGQIQLIPRRWKDKKDAWHVSHQTLLGRDSYRILADRTGELDGSETEPRFNGEGLLVSATATVWRKGKTHSFRETVYLDEYRSENSPFWKGKPITMLSKVAEAQAIRKAFPSLLTGTNIVEELDADRETGEVLEPPHKPSTPPPPLSTLPTPIADITALDARISASGIDRESFLQFLFEVGRLGAGPAYAIDSKLHLEDLQPPRAKALFKGWEAALKAFAEWESSRPPADIPEKLDAAIDDWQESTNPAYIPEKSALDQLREKLHDAKIDEGLFLEAIADGGGEKVDTLGELSPATISQLVEHWKMTLAAYERWESIHHDTYEGAPPEEIPIG